MRMEGYAVTLWTLTGNLYTQTVFEEVQFIMKSCVKYADVAYMQIYPLFIFYVITENQIITMHF